MLPVELMVMTKRATRADKGGVLFRLTPRTTLSGRIYAANSRLQLNNSPQGIGSLPATGIIEAIPLSPTRVAAFRSGCANLAAECWCGHLHSCGERSRQPPQGRFFSGAVIFTQWPSQTFGYSISYQGLATNRTSINGSLGVGRQPIEEMSNRILTDESIHSMRDLICARDAPTSSPVVTSFESENFKNPSFQPNPADNSNVDVHANESHALCSGSIAIHG